MKAQEEFMTDYFAKTGYNYVHYFGQDGPRKPPKFFMWPADEVGDVYNTITPNGYW